MEDKIKALTNEQELIQLLVQQQQIIRIAMEKTYSRRMFEVGFDLYKKITIKRVNEVDDLYLVTEFTDHQKAPTTLESWKAYYNWFSRQLIEIGGQKRVLYFETEDNKLHKETGNPTSCELETFTYRSWIL
eukprot:gene19883-23643_t